MRVTVVVLALVVASCLAQKRALSTSSYEATGTQEVFSSDATPAAKNATYTTSWYNSYIDNFNFENKATFKQRILVVDSFFNPKNPGPVFFYTGNEGPIEVFFDNTGFMLTLAEEFNALVLFAEHRYYGSSLPFGDESFTNENIGFLSIEQALADYANIVAYFKNEVYNIPNAPVVSFGGSYGGLLTAWFRMKYPETVDIALAASAPIRSVCDEVESTAFMATVTKDFAQTADTAAGNCADLVRKAFAEVQELAGTEEGRSQLTADFRLCNPIAESDVEHMILWVQNSFLSLAMVDYAYPADFLAPLPGWPVNVSCSRIQEHAAENNVVAGLAAAAGLFYNGTGGDLPCFNLTSEFVQCADQTGCGLGPSGLAWDYQVCTEIPIPIATNNVTDMFLPRNWTYADDDTYCNATFGVTPRPQWCSAQFGGDDLSSASYILFSNGLLDPWHTGGILEFVGDTIIPIIIEQGAHHADLRPPNMLDPPSVRAARQIERQYISEWLELATQARKEGRVMGA